MFDRPSARKCPIRGPALWSCAIPCAVCSSAEESLKKSLNAEISPPRSRSAVEFEQGFALGSKQRLVVLRRFEGHSHEPPRKLGGKFLYLSIRLDFGEVDGAFRLYCTCIQSKKF